MLLAGRKIVLGVTGSIAAYKAAHICRLLRKEGAEVKVVMTASAVSFITPLTLSTLSNHPVMVDLSNDDSTWNNHVELGLWADLFLIAPASANTIAKCANGLCDNLLNAVYLSSRCKVMIAPAMDHDMFLHPSTQINLNRLKSFGNILIGPAVGELASGLNGEGRMLEPEIILEHIVTFFASKGTLKGKNVLVSAGPTHEPIDPVRFISNNSTGKMGFAIADELVKQGASVTLVAGPNNLTIPANVKYIGITTANEMHNICIEEFAKSDIAIMSAAVADFTPEISADHKIKKSSGLNTILLKPTVDILELMGKLKKNHQFLVGFALETQDALNYGKEKMLKKNLDLIVVNTLADAGAGFGYDTNKVTLIDKKENVNSFELKSKTEVAIDIVNKIISLYNA